MTELLEEAFAAVSQLPETDQNAIANLILEQLFERLEYSYELREKNHVISFLKNHSFLVLFLLEAPTKIRHHFQEAKLALKVVSDPEIIKSMQLVLLIATKSLPEEALKKLESLDKDWWLGVPHQVWNLVLPTLEYNDEF